MVTNEPLKGPVAGFLLFKTGAFDPDFALTLY